VEVLHHGQCCAYRHKAREEGDHYDEFYNGTVLDRHTNFTLYLEVNQSVSIPEKCLNLTCVHDNVTCAGSGYRGLPVLTARILKRGCDCCFVNGTQYVDGDMISCGCRNLTCCGGQFVAPRSVFNVTYETMGDPRPVEEVLEPGKNIPAGAVPFVPVLPQPHVDDPLCYKTCFDPANSYHNTFLGIIDRLKAEQAAKGSKGVGFLLDMSFHGTSLPHAWKYERNLAMLLALTLPVSADNPFFATKYAGYVKSCSYNLPAWQCQTDKCSAARCLADPAPENKQDDSKTPSMSTYYTPPAPYDSMVPGFGLGQLPFMGVLWHGTLLAHRSFQSPDFTCGWEKQLVVAIINKHWQEALGGAGGYANPTNSPDGWIGPSGYGRVVAALGIDGAPPYPSTYPQLSKMQQFASSPDLAWKLASSQAWHDELVSLLQCLDTSCCSGTISSQPGGVPKTAPQFAFLKGNTSGSAIWQDLWQTLEKP